MTGLHSRVRRALEEIDRGRNPDRETGHLYLIRSAEFVKVGHSTHIPKRLRDIRSLNPHAVELVGVFRTAVRAEGGVHKIMKAHRHRFEWFHWNDEFEQLREFCDCCKIRDADHQQSAPTSLIRCSLSGPELSIYQYDTPERERRRSVIKSQMLYR